VETHEIPVELEASSFSRLLDSPSLIELFLSTCDHTKSARRNERGQRSNERTRQRNKSKRKRETDRFSSPVFFPVFFPSRMEFSIYETRKEVSSWTRRVRRRESETRTRMSLLLIHRSHRLLVLPLLLPLMNLQLTRSSLEVSKGLVANVDGLVDDVVEEVLVVRGDDDSTVAFGGNEVLLQPDGCFEVLWRRSDGGGEKVRGGEDEKAGMERKRRVESKREREARTRKLLGSESIEDGRTSA